MIRLYSGDREELHRYHPDLGFNDIIRLLVHAHVKSLSEKESRANVGHNLSLDNVLDGHDLGTLSPGPDDVDGG